MGWNPLDDPIDYFELAGQRSPGLATILGAGSPRGWDIRKGYGYSGAIIWFTGIGLAKFSAKIELYEATDWEDWHAFKSLVKKPPLGVRPKALDIWHPLLEDLEIKSVVVEDLLQPVQTQPGVWEIQIKFLQHRALKFSLAKPDGSQDRVTDPVELRIQERTGVLKNLNNQLATGSAP